MREKVFRFPGFKYKALTLSYDDGTIYDKKLIEIMSKYGIRGTFNLSTTFFRDRWGLPTNLSTEEAVALYYPSGNEVAIHGANHWSLTKYPTDQMVGFFVANTGVVADTLAHPGTPPYQNKNTPHGGVFISGGSGWIRTSSGLSQQIYSLPRLSNSGARPICTKNNSFFLVRAEGIEPSFQAWKACILAFVLCPQQIESFSIIYYLDTKSSVYLFTF